MAGASSQKGYQKSSSHIVALLSLKILLLAFFILLNALSSFEEEKRSAVVDSVREAFQGVLPASVNLRRNPAALDVFKGAEEVIDELHQIFGAGLPIVEREDSPGSWTLQVDVPESELFSEDGRELLPVGAEILRLIAGVLGDPEAARAVYRLDLLYGVRGSNSGLDGHREALARAGVLVRELERQGLTSSRLSTGLLPSFAGQVRLYFTVQLDAPRPAGAAAGGGEN
ncbi:flagellar motor protein MotB [Pelagibius sp. CAU 1746]|uniref:flagellar motor protein MotB n=1 Tax=Pelagibius sp. CAU 1746 TaxID=3140370 RepID=UPI00325BD4CC